MTRRTAAGSAAIGRLDRVTVWLASGDITSLRLPWPEEIHELHLSNGNDPVLVVHRRPGEHPRGWLEIYPSSRFKVAASLHPTTTGDGPEPGTPAPGPLPDRLPVSVPSTTGSADAGRRAVTLDTRDRAWARAATVAEIDEFDLAPAGDIGVHVIDRGGQYLEVHPTTATVLIARPL